MIDGDVATVKAWLEHPYIGAGNAMNHVAIFLMKRLELAQADPSLSPPEAQGSRQVPNGFGVRHQRDLDDAESLCAHLESQGAAHPLADLAAAQQPLPADAAKILHDHAWALYGDGTASAAGSAPELPPQIVTMSGTVVNRCGRCGSEEGWYTALCGKCYDGKAEAAPPHAPLSDQIVDAMNRADWHAATMLLIQKVDGLYREAPPHATSIVEHAEWCNVTKMALRSCNCGIPLPPSSPEPAPHEIATLTDADYLAMLNRARAFERWRIEKGLPVPGSTPAPAPRETDDQVKRWESA